MQVSAVRHLRIDVDGVRHDCGLAADAELLLAATWHSTGTALRGVGSRIFLRKSSAEAELMVVLPGHLLSGEVHLGAELCVSRCPGQPRDGFVPYRPGSRLWSDVRRVLLEGLGARFPIEVVDFAALVWTPIDAGWVLDWVPDAPDAPLLGNIRLLVNSRRSNIVAAASTMRPDASAAAIRSAIFCDIGRQIIQGMLDNDEFCSGRVDWPAGSIGRHAQGLLRTFFGSESPDSLRTMMRGRRNFFEARLQQQFRLFEA